MKRSMISDACRSSEGHLAHRLTFSADTSPLLRPVPQFLIRNGAVSQTTPISDDLLKTNEMTCRAYTNIPRSVSNFLGASLCDSIYVHCLSA